MIKLEPIMSHSQTRGGKTESTKRDTTTENLPVSVRNPTPPKGRKFVKKDNEKIVG